MLLTKNLTKKYRLLTFAVAFVALLLGAASLIKRGDAVATESNTSPPAVAVTIHTVQPEQIQIWSEFSGKLVAVNSAVIRPEVNGRITEIRFRDGQDVKAGQILFVIDPRPYEAALAQAQATLTTAKTNAVLASKEVTRARQLIKTSAIAQRVLDERTTVHETAQAAMQSAKAVVKHAELDMEHAYVKAPIAGRVGRAEITVGNVVQAGSTAPTLTSIVANDTVYADFEVDERTYLQAVRSGNKSNNAERSIPVELTLSDDKKHIYQGFIHAFDNQISGSSGTIRARAKFANTDGTLVVGMFVSVKMGSESRDTFILVPDRAISTDQSKKFVYVVGEGNKVAYREVILGSATGGKRVVTSGLSAGDKVIVDGVQHVRPDAVVNPKEADGE